ncbi:MAG: holo-ACP synthase [Erysipelotrichaceae bacterium]|nr:holo-ACP synthase [Erysipelotrichaceae bacterium]
MIKGIGVDMVYIPEIRHFLEDEKLASSFISHTFTPSEVNACKSHNDPAEYYATRFAAKEAVYKAIAHLNDNINFDFRKIETLNHSDGAPYINIIEELKDILESSDISSLHISITTEHDYVTAFVVAE